MAFCTLNESVTRHLDRQFALQLPLLFQFPTLETGTMYFSVLCYHSLKVEKNNRVNLSGFGWGLP